MKKLLPGDDAEVYRSSWSRARLMATDRRFCEVMRAALATPATPPPHPAPSTDPGP